MIGDREILAFRQDYYHLLVSIFRNEPSAEILQGLTEGIGERIDAARKLNPLLAEGWEEIDRFLGATPAAQIAESVSDEYARLFIGPYGPIVNPYESFYLTGRLFDRPLADLRITLKTLGIEKQDGYAEPEDFLAFELEVMRWLTAKQQASATPEEEKRRMTEQAEFLKQHLLVWAPSCAEDIERAQSARFYRGAAKLLRGFLELERAYFSGWGPDKVATLEEARRRYGAIPAWKGPTFDFDPGEVPKDPPSSRYR